MEGDVIPGFGRGAGRVATYAAGPGGFSPYPTTDEAR
jgi:hypothetical protein